MRSAYAIADDNGSEPSFTNYAWTAWSDEPFCETLDYIWLSPDWNVETVVSLPERSSLEGVESFPSESEPSDHILVGAKLQLKA